MIQLSGSRVYAKPPVPKMPPGLVELMNDLSKEVLRSNPPDIHVFCADHMLKLLEIRDGTKPLVKEPKFKPHKNTLSLEERIKSAQEKVRLRAEERWRRIDAHYPIQNEQIDDIASIPDENYKKEDHIHHEKDLSSTSEVEIFHETDNINDEITKPENINKVEQMSKSVDIDNKEKIESNYNEGDMSIVSQIDDTDKPNDLVNHTEQENNVANEIVLSESNCSITEETLSDNTMEPKYNTLKMASPGSGEEENYKEVIETEQIAYDNNDNDYSFAKDNKESSHSSSNSKEGHARIKNHIDSPIVSNEAAISNTNCNILHDVETSINMNEKEGNTNNNLDTIKHDRINCEAIETDQKVYSESITSLKASVMQNEDSENNDNQDNQTDNETLNERQRTTHAKESKQDSMNFKNNNKTEIVNPTSQIMPDKGSASPIHTNDFLVNDSHVNKTQSHIMDLETAAITIQKVFRNFLFKSKSSTVDEEDNLDSNSIMDNVKKEETNLLLPGKERKALGISRMDTVLQTVNEEKSLSLSTEDSSTLSSAATIIQAHVRGFLARNKLNSNKTFSASIVKSDPSKSSVEEETEQQKKTVLNIHIVPDGHLISRDESLMISVDLPYDGSPLSSINLHPLGYDKSERRKQLKREDAFQSITPPSNNSGKSSESVQDLVINEKETLNKSEISPSISSNVEGNENEKTNSGSDDISSNAQRNDNEKSDSGSGNVNSNVVKIENEKTNSGSDNVNSNVEKIENEKSDSGSYINIVTEIKPEISEEISKRDIKDNVGPDETDVVVTPFVRKNSQLSMEKVRYTNSHEDPVKLLHTGEFHDVVLPTKVLRGDSSVVREFKNVLVYFLLWNNA